MSFDTLFAVCLCGGFFVIGPIAGIIAGVIDYRRSSIDDRTSAAMSAFMLGWVIFAFWILWVPFAAVFFTAYLLIVGINKLMDLHASRSAQKGNTDGN